MISEFIRMLFATADQPSTVQTGEGGWQYPFADSITYGAEACKLTRVIEGYPARYREGRERSGTEARQ